MIAGAFLVFVGLVVLSVFALMLTRSASLDYAATWTRLHRPGVEKLVYDIPNGLDPAAVIVALGRAGYAAVEDTRTGAHQVWVACPEGQPAARSRVRAVLEDATAPAYIPVWFADEH